MSFSSKEPTKNPAQMFFEFSSVKKQFLAWDKENKKTIPLPLPAKFVVLDELHSVSGYSDKYNCGFYSNEVHNLSEQPLTVKTFKGGFEQKGLYKDIKEVCISAGAKYTKSLYVLYYSEKNGNYLLFNIKLSGAANNAWIDAGINTRKNVVLIKDEFREGKKGATTYNVPIFESLEMPEEFAKQAELTDSQVLQPYLQEKLGEVDVNDQSEQ